MHGGLGIREIALYDNRPPAAALMGSLCSAIADGTTTRITTPASADDAIADSSFVISSIRVGNMGARARDERLSLECGFAGQETTGPAGFAMALRTIPVALDYARTVERIAAAAWFINFTNPAGIITQAISTHTNAKVVGICDTPAELFHQIARALEEALEDVECDYFGLNHLGWVRAVRVRGEDVTSKLLADDELLRRLYRAELFPPALIRGLGLIPTEYLFFYYNQSPGDGKPAPCRRYAGRRTRPPERAGVGGTGGTHAKKRSQFGAGRLPPLSEPAQCQLYEAGRRRRLCLRRTRSGLGSVRRRHRLPPDSRSTVLRLFQDCVRGS